MRDIKYILPNLINSYNYFFENNHYYLILSDGIGHKIDYSNISFFMVNALNAYRRIEEKVENQIANINGELTFKNKIYDDNEWLLSEDMVGQIKDIIFKRDLLNQRHETDEIPSTIKYD